VGCFQHLSIKAVPTTNLNTPAPAVEPPATEVTRLRDLSRAQVRSGIAAWLGWTFDGLDMHLYTFVAAPFVAQLLGATTTMDSRVGRYSSIIQEPFCSAGRWAAVSSDASAIAWAARGR